MLEPDICSEYIRSEFFEARLNISAPFSTWISKCIEPILLKVMHSTNPIPVYRQDPRHITQTFNQSIDGLLSGENLLVFTENGVVDPCSSQVRQFFNGFIYLTKLYYRKTKKRLSFVPVAVNPRQHTICVEKAIRYQPESNYQQEQYRIYQNLMRQLTRSIRYPGPRRGKCLHSIRYGNPHTRLRCRNKQLCGIPLLAEFSCCDFKRCAAIKKRREHLTPSASLSSYFSICWGHHSSHKQDCARLITDQKNERMIRAHHNGFLYGRASLSLP